MTVWIFGNPDYEPDALPLKILPALKQQLPDLEFVIKDPNEDWELPERLIILDTVQGIERVTQFTSLAQFSGGARTTVHDFDLGMKLAWLAKLKKLPPFVIIGIPMGAGEKEVIDEVIAILREIKN